jgi:hypothetical protein
LAQEPLILVDVVLKCIDLVFLHPPVAGDEIAVGVALAAGRERKRQRERSDAH